MHVQRRVSVEAPPQLVWDVVTDLRRAKDGLQGLDDYPFISPDWPQKGARAIWRYPVGPLRIRFELTVTESVPGRSLQVANRSILGQGLEVYSFTTSGRTTTAWYDASDDPNSLGKIVMPILEKRIIRQIDAAIEQLKEQCRRRAGSRAS